MASQFLDSRDEKNTGLHDVIAAINKQLARLRTPDTAFDAETLHELRGFWSQLVTLLDLTPIPERRECPSCGHVGMRAATRCSHCWISLVPPPAMTKTDDSGAAIYPGTD